MRMPSSEPISPAEKALIIVGSAVGIGLAVIGIVKAFKTPTTKPKEPSP